LDKNTQKNKKMSVLYITNKPIYPAVDGGCVAMASFISHLLEIHDKVDHFTVSTHKHPFNLKDYPSVLSKKIQVYHCFINTKISIIDATLNLFSSSSYNVSRFYNKNFESLLIELLKNKHEIIYIESIFLLPYLNTIRKFSNAKVILRAPNIEFKIWEKNIERTSNFFKKIYLKHLTKNLKTYELNQFHKVDGILSISNLDYNYILNLNLSIPILNLPFAITPNPTENIDKNNFFFIGAYNWKPNLDAVLFLINELFPSILKINPNAKLHIAGSYMPNYFYGFQNESIKIYGKVDSVEGFMKKHGILLAPIFSGSGVRIKILEALSFGIPVIGSNIAIQGINSKACFVAESIDEYLIHIQKITNTDIQKITIEATTYIDKNYNPRQIESKLNDFIESC
jgi:glycosyltransferase involved in cell wall biosynthesis